MTFTFTALAICILSHRIACISCRLYFIIRHCPVANTGDRTQPSPVGIPNWFNSVAWGFVRAWMRVCLAETRAVSVSERLLCQVEIHDHPNGS
jgi:hypothetical protein